MGAAKSILFFTSILIITGLLTAGSVKAVDSWPVSASHNGCPYGDKTIVNLRVANRSQSGGPVKTPLAGAEVRVFDTNSPYFRIVAGSKHPKKYLYGTIFEASKRVPAGLMGNCTTDSSGACLIGENYTGDFLVITGYYDTETNTRVYAGKYKGVGNFVDTDGDGFKDLATREFTFTKTYDRKGNIIYRGSTRIVIPGSYLEILVPESTIWESDRSVYPLVFDSDSTWSIEVCADMLSPGYEITGVYDENGNPVPYERCMQTFVAGETRMLAFEVEGTGSKEPTFKALIKVAGPEGNKATEVIFVEDVRMSTFEESLAEAEKAGRGAIGKSPLITGFTTMEAAEAFFVIALIAVLLAVLGRRKIVR